MSKINFIQISRSSFTSLLAGTLPDYTLDESTLYFVYDSATDTVGDLYRGSVKMSYPAMVVSARPTTPLKNTIYVNTTSGVSEIYDGSKWIGVGPKIVTSAVTNVDGYVWAGDTADDASVPTVKAVGEFVNKAISDVTGGSGVVTSVTKNATDGKQLDVVTNGVTEGIILDGLVTDLAYNATTGALTLTKTVNGVATPMTAVNLPLEQALTGVTQHTVSSGEAGSGIYADAVEGEVGLLLTVTNLSNNTTVQYWVSLQGFVDDHNVVANNGSNPVVSVSVSDAVVLDGVLTWQISATFNAANLADGAIAQSKINGLTAALAGKMALATDAMTDHLAIFGIDGQVTDSGIFVNDILTRINGDNIGNSIIVNDSLGGLSATNIVLGSDDTTATNFGTANTVATEVAVKTYTDSKINALDASTTASTATADTTSANNGVSVVATVTQTDGLVSMTTLKADKYGAASKALTDANAYTDEALTWTVIQ